MSLIRSTITVGVFTGMSRILGMVREMLLSHIVGSSMISDAFVIAFKLPNFFRRFFAEGAFNAAFVPQFSGRFATEGAESAKTLAEQVFAVMTWSLLIFVVLVEIFTKPFLLLVVPGLMKTPERLELAITFTRITFPYIFFVSLVAFLSGVLNSLDRFAAAAATPMLLNIVLITALSCVPLYGVDPGVALCIGVFVAGSAQFAWLYFMCIRRGFRMKLKRPRLTPDVRRILKLMIPGSIGAGVMQINLFVEMMLASFLPIGAMSYLYYADRLNQLPLSIFGVAISTVLLPTLSRQWRQNQLESAMDTQTKALEISMQFTLPAAIGLAIFSYPFIDLMYGHGKFTQADVLQTAPALAAFVIGLPAYAAGKVFSTTFFSREDTRTPVRIAIVTIVINLFLNIAFMQFYGHIGLAIATSITAWINTVLLGIILYKRQIFIFDRPLISKLTRMLTASLIMGGMLYYATQIFVYPGDNGWREIVYNFTGISGGILIYGLIAIILGVSPLEHIQRSKKKV